MKKQLINQANIAYVDEGKGHPILLGHSFLWDAHMWQAQTTQLKENYRCIVPDLWSHGQSDALPHKVGSLETLADDYWQFSQALSLQKFALVGLSVGGMWAAHLALTHPEAISALVLMDTYVGAEPEAPKAVYLSLLDEMERSSSITPEFAHKVAPYFFAKKTKEEQPHLVENFIKNLLATPAQHIAGKAALGRIIFNRSSLLEQLKNIQIPTLIIVGEEDLPRPPYEAQEMTQLIPNATLEIIPKAGHICTVEQPQYVNKIIDRFLTQAIMAEV